VELAVLVCDRRRVDVPQAQLLVDEHELACEVVSRELLVVVPQAQTQGSRSREDQ
jgi:hypothetical protein